MANPQQVGILRQDIRKWNGWRLKHYDIQPDLRDANLIIADLIYANLSNANLRGATLNGSKICNANLRGANLNRANLNNVDLSNADLRNTNLSNADLSNANLNNADLRNANLSNTNLNSANFSHTRIGWTVFGNVDLRVIRGLQEIQHIGPSFISTSTLEKSQGDIPEVFLRGAGVNDTIINYIRMIANKFTQYYTCFISYSSNDKLFARRLYNDLQQEGVRCWFALEDMNIGDKIKHRIDESISLYDKLLLILSKSSIESNWVAYEVERALMKELQSKQDILYPVQVDGTILSCETDWAKNIKETRHIGNFEQWTNPEQYQESFQRLLRALRGKQEKS